MALTIMEAAHQSVSRKIREAEAHLIELDEQRRAGATGCVITLLLGILAAAVWLAVT